MKTLGRLESLLNETKEIRGELQQALFHLRNALRLILK